ncbi:cobalt-factor II C(20)-methyltransferase [Streptococcus catagoni]|uniref:cobalt-factor II C(20)-methyltransferase n=1 Tax=Streptococcus catagoni TaxID=2654874 RepID=UPI00140946B1|nr:cobalt-factor II C(20)-methyltransferase [Streptococcus catagoni]
MAKFYGIGIGPGDSQLITVKASKLLGELDIIYTPEAKKAGKSLALTIAEPYLSEAVEIKQRHFPMVACQSEKEAQWQSIGQEIIADVLSGKNVAFITLGDAMLYSTYSYLLEIVGSQIETQTIPGITSFSTMASVLGQPLTMDEESLAVVPATAPASKIEAALQIHDSLVLMKVANHLDKILPLLEKYQLLDKTFLVSHASMPEQKILRGVSDLRLDSKLSYFTTMIVKKTILS